MMPKLDYEKLYHQLHIDGYKKYRKFFMKHNLALSVLLECLGRAWFGSQENNLGLSKWQFVLSKTEYALFWLRESQANNIVTALKALDKEWFIKNTGTKIRNSNANIYEFIPSDFITPLWSIGSEDGSWNEKVDSSIGIKEIDTIKENKDKEKVFVQDRNLLIQKIPEISSQHNLVFSTDDPWNYLDKLLSDETYNQSLKLLESKLKKKYKRSELILKIYKFAIKEDGFRRKHISDFESLHRVLPKIINNIL